MNSCECGIDLVSLTTNAKLPKCMFKHIIDPELGMFEACFSHKVYINSGIS